MEWTKEQKQKYYKIPKALLTDQYISLSTDAVLLYGILSDRACLSHANASKGAWITPNGEVYVYYTLEDMQRRLRCGHDKATKVCRELELAGLIRRIPVGYGRPYQIVVYPPASRCGGFARDTADNPKSRGGKTASNNTDELLSTDSNNTAQMQTVIENDLQSEWDIESAYRAFYAAYPEHRKEQYEQGMATYRKIVRTQADATKMQDSLTKWLRSPLWQQDGGRYIPLLSNYLLRGYVNKQVPVSRVPFWGSGTLGEEELEAIEKLMGG